MTNKVLVTGGAGFIGHSFVKLCVSAGLHVSIIDKLTYAGDKIRISNILNKVNFFEVDISNPGAIDEIFKEVNPRFVVHFAAESHVDRSIENAYPFMNSNVIGTQVLLDKAKKYGVEKFINISTDEVYGDLESTGEFFEYTEFSPNSPYSVSKAAADMLGNAYFRTFKMPVVTVRPSNNFGPYQFPEKLIPVVIIRALKNLSIPVYGRGDNIREWLYVEDSSKGIMEIMFNGKSGEAYNLGSGVEKTNIDIVKLILSRLGKSEELITFVEDRLGHDFRYRLNSEKIYNDLGFRAETKFEEGIQRTVDWYVENQNWWEKYIDF